jgi:hypothetical protein
VKAEKPACSSLGMKGKTERFFISVKVELDTGHNDIDYENKTNKELSFTFENENQNRLIINALLWLGRK